MIKKPICRLFFILLSLLSLSGTAQALVKMGVIEGGGKSCQVLGKWDEKGNTLKITLKSFEASSGAKGGKGMVRSVCSFSWPVEIPAGMSLVLTPLSGGGKGKFLIPEKGKAAFSLEYFFSGTSGQFWKEEWSGPLQKEKEAWGNHFPQGKDISFSSCPKPAGTLLRGNGSLLLRAPSGQVDLEAEMVFSLSLRKC